MLAAAAPGGGRPRVLVEAGGRGLGPRCGRCCVCCLAAPCSSPESESSTSASAAWKLVVSSVTSCNRCGDLNKSAKTYHINKQS